MKVGIIGVVGVAAVAWAWQSSITSAVDPAIAAKVNQAAVDGGTQTVAVVGGLGTTAIAEAGDIVSTGIGAARTAAAESGVLTAPAAAGLPRQPAPDTSAPAAP